MIKKNYVMNAGIILMHKNFVLFNTNTIKELNDSDLYYIVDLIIEEISNRNISKESLDYKNNLIKLSSTSCIN